MRSLRYFWDGVAHGITVTKFGRQLLTYLAL